MQRYNVVSVVHMLVEAKLKEANCLVDATCGNGNDTLFLAKYSGNDAAVWAFDTQCQACANTAALLQTSQLSEKVSIIQDSHENISQYITCPIDICMFNLGYLPGASHTTVTKHDATMRALKLVIEMLNVGGLISIAAYPGHPEGRIENLAVYNYLKTLNKRIFTVSSWFMLNHEAAAPRVYLIERVRGGRHEECTSCEN